MITLIIFSHLSLYFVIRNHILCDNLLISVFFSNFTPICTFEYRPMSRFILTSFHSCIHSQYEFTIVFFSSIKKVKMLQFMRVCECVTSDSSHKKKSYSGGNHGIKLVDCFLCINT